MTGVVMSSESGDSVRIDVEEVKKTVRLALVEAPAARSSGETGCLPTNRRTTCADSCRRAQPSNSRT